MNSRSKEGHLDYDRLVDKASFQFKFRVNMYK